MNFSVAYNPGIILHLAEQLWFLALLYPVENVQILWGKKTVKMKQKQMDIVLHKLILSAQKNVSVSNTTYVCLQYKISHYINYVKAFWAYVLNHETLILLCRYVNCELLLY